MSQHYELAIVGGGTAAITAVMHALSRGVESIALIESRKTLGGECALNACVPTKTLLTAAKLWNKMRHDAGTYGIHITDSHLNFTTLMNKVEAVIQDGGDPFINDPRVKIFHDYARFENPVTLLLSKSREQIRAERFIVASGAAPRKLTIPGASEVGYITFQEATHLKELPQSLAIIGAGPVGVELAYIYASLGVQVSLLQKHMTVLPLEEPEIQQAVQAMLERQGVRIYPQAKLVRMDTGKTAAKSISIETSEAGALQIEVDEILSAIGMAPRVTSMGLEAANIQYTLGNGIRVNTQMQTTNPFVWAIGDVVKHYAFTHVADYQAEIAVDNALFNRHTSVDYTGIGWGIYTDPTVAHIGLTEAQASENFPEVDTLICNAHEVSRYRIESESEGFIKLIIDKRTQQLLGGHIFASAAEEMAHVLMLAIRQGMTCQSLLSSMIYIYPARTQLIQKALESYLALSKSPGTARYDTFKMPHQSER